MLVYGDPLVLQDATDNAFRRLALEADAIDVLARRRGRLGPLVRPTPSR